MSFYLRRIFLLLASLSLSACAQFSAGNLFSHYSAQNNDLHQAVKVGDYSRAAEHVPDQVAGDILDNLEKGRVYFLDQQYEQSKTALELSDSAVTQQQDQAVISVSSTATSVGSLAINDNLSEYTPADYELGFLHLYLGLNYLQRNQLEGALVEMRRANLVQEQARQNRQAELERAQKELRSNGVSPNLGAVLAQYPDAGTTLQAVQNGYLLYLSALLYEASNDLNSAYVDYRRALAVAEDNQSVIDGTLRVAQRLGMREDLRQLSERYGVSSSLRPQQGRVIIIEEQGVVDSRQGWRLSLPLSDSRGNTALYSLALPYYGSSQQETFSPLQLNQSMFMGDLLTDVHLMAQHDLSERIPTMVIRQALRVVVKDQIRKESTQSDGIGNLIFNVFNTLTEQPDTRSWLTLPDRVLTHSEVVGSGEQVLQVGTQHYRFTVPEGGTTLVWLSRQGSNATLWHKQLGRL
ncbi:hypothetical protein EXA13_00545 [Vibrio cincinnatiensis]|nr:hypothetical protein [Vibrio cincinnatiensis]